MKHTSFLNELSAYDSKYPAENATTQRFKQFVSTYDNCFDRSLQCGHVTGSAWLLNRAGTHVLLTHHRKLNRWLQLGGHADGNPDVLAVSLKEAQEESGIPHIKAVSEHLLDIDIHQIPANSKEPAHLHYDGRYLLQTSISDDFIVSSESHALEWVELNKLCERTDEQSMLRMAEKTAQLL